MVIEPRFSSASSFCEGLAKVEDLLPGSRPSRGGLFSERGFYGYIDKSGRFSIPPAFREAEDFSDGMALVQKGGAWGFIDRSGALVIKHPKGEKPENFRNGLARVLVGDTDVTRAKIGYIDKTGNYVWKPQQ
jgi:hypothetical protein